MKTKQYNNTDEFIDCMGGSAKELIELAIGASFEEFIKKLPYTVHKDDPVIQKFWQENNK